MIPIYLYLHEENNRSSFNFYQICVYAFSRLGQKKEKKCDGWEWVKVEKVTEKECDLREQSFKWMGSWEKFMIWC